MSENTAASTRAAARLGNVLVRLTGLASALCLLPAGRRSMRLADLGRCANVWRLAGVRLRTPVVRRLTLVRGLVN
mgnify:CR=1 FL=1